MGRGARAGVVAVVCALFAAPALAAAETAPVVSAHRARVAGTAENSLAGFRAAAQEGETDVEGDAHVTKDGVLVVSHDSPLRAPRCSGPYLDVPLRRLEAAQVDQMTCGGEPVARLADVIDALGAYPGVTLRIEIKHSVFDTSTRRRSDAVLLARLLAATGMTERSIVQDFSWATTARHVHAASPGQRVSALSSRISTASVRAARSAGVYDYSYAAGLATGFWNRYIAAQGLRSTVWTVNDTRRARALRAQNVGTVISDVPETVRDALAAPDSGCTVTAYSRTTTLRATSTLAAGGRLYLPAPRTAPDGRVVESTSVRVTARTASGTATVHVAPQGAPYTSEWEQPVAVTSTSRSTVVATPLGDGSGVRIRNDSTRAVTIAVTAVGGTVHTCP